MSSSYGLLFFFGNCVLVALGYKGQWVAGDGNFDGLGVINVIPKQLGDKNHP